WISYGPETRAIATAFVRGVNAWVAIAREHLPEEFVLAGWRPELWQAEDLLNRTNAFVASADARSEVFRARLIAAAGRKVADALLPSGPAAASTEIPRGLDVKTISFVISDQLRRVGTAPFFTGPAAGSTAWAVGGARSATGAPLVANDPHRALENPSLRYLVQLTAPGWTVTCATSPALPGVAIGR